MQQSPLFHLLVQLGFEAVAFAEGQREAGAGDNDEEDANQGDDAGNGQRPEIVI